MEIAKEQFDENGLMKNGDGFWGFIDWTEGLNKQSAMQGVYIYCAKKVQKIAELLGDTEKAEELKKEAEAKTASAKKYLFDEKIGLFVSGDEKQINYASQVWMILAEVVSGEEGAEILQNLHMEAALSTATATHGAALRLIFSENILTEASKSLAGARISA